MQHLDEGTLQTWLDRERAGLDPSELAAIEGHLSACAECAARLEDLAALDGRAHTLLAVTAGDAAPPFDAVVRRAEGTHQRRRALTRLRSLAWAASIVAAVGVGWMTNEIYRGGLRPAPSLAPSSATERASSSLPEAEAAPPERLRESAEADRSEPQGGAVPSPADIAPAPPAAQDVVAEFRVAAEEERQAAGLGASAGRPSTAEPAAPEPAAAARRPDDDLARDSFADATGGGTVVVGGRVEDGQGGAPIAGVQVYIEDLRVGALTRPDGTYTLRIPTADENELTSYEVTATRVGYRTQRREVAGRAGESVVADFTLREEALQLQEVIVTGTRGPADTAQRRASANEATTVAAIPEPASWQASTLAQAEAVLGSVWLVEDLDVVSVETARLAGTTSTFVRIRQRLPGGAVLRLVEGVADPAVGAWAVDADDPVESRRIDDVVVTATAPVPAEELTRLLGTLR